MASPAPPTGSTPVVESGSGQGIKRVIATAALSALLLVGGAVAAVSAASPDPSSSPSTAPSTDGGTQPKYVMGDPANCPNMGGDDSSGSSGSSGSDSAPSATPQT
jgi:hypothetical protein